jgi:general stress protein 26
MKRARTDAEHVFRAARATMRRKKLALLATQGTGGVDARVLQPFPPDDDLVVFMGTRRGSRKAQQIEESGRATLVYEDDAKDACVTLIGKASIVEDDAMRAKYFSDLWYAFFPGGPLSDEYVLIRFEPEKIEVLDFARKVTPPPFGLRAATLTQKDGRWEIAELAA